MGAIKAKRSHKIVEKKDGRFGLGYVPSKQELELQRMQRERVQASRSGAFPGQQQGPDKNSKVIRMAEFNEDDQDVEDDADGETMAQIYSKDTLQDFQSR